MTYVFIDTMIYLHYTWFEELSFGELVGDSDVSIVVPRVTVGELDNHKDGHKSSKVRKLAQRVIAKFLSCFLDDEGLKGELRLLEFEESVSFDFKSYNLDKAKNDHRLLASIVEFKKQATGKTILITQDAGARLTARRLGINTIEIPDSHKREPAEDPLVKENRALRNELLKIQSARPKLSLQAVGGGNGRIEFVVEPATDVFDPIKALAKVEDAYPYLSKPGESPYGVLNALATSTYANIPESEYDRYNEEREEFIQDCHEYVYEMEAIQLKRIVELNLYIENSGLSPAEDVDVYLHFPDGFELFKADELPDDPVMPTPPEEPCHPFQRNLRNFERSIFVPSFDNLSATPSLPDTFSLKKTNSYEVLDQFERIKHGHQANINTLAIIFESYDTASSFSIDYRLTAANLPEAVEGRLNVQVKKI